MNASTQYDGTKKFCFYINRESDQTELLSTITALGYYVFLRSCQVFMSNNEVRISTILLHLSMHTQALQKNYPILAKEFNIQTRFNKATHL